MLKNNTYLPSPIADPSAFSKLKQNELYASWSMKATFKLFGESIFRK